MTLLGAFVSEIGVLLGLALLVFIVWKVGKFMFKIIFGIISNTVLGFVVLYLANTVLGLGIPFSIPVIAATALFGLPGVGTIIVLQLLGIVI